MERLYVFKFGGSCFKTHESLEKSLSIIRHYIDSGKLVIVTSAFYGVTDSLINWMNMTSESDTSELEESIAELQNIEALHMEFIERMFPNGVEKESASDYTRKKFSELRELIPELAGKTPDEKIKDIVRSYGERLSTYIFSEFLKTRGFDTAFFSADDGLLITDRVFGSALPILSKIKETIPSRLNPPLKENKIVCFTGYYGCTEEGEITTLGRGGTDFTATIVAYALSEYYPTRVIFWKDVYGILTANPKYEPHAKLIREISFAEAKELAFFGSKVLHPLCLTTAEQSGVEVEIRNFEDPFSPKFTLITKKIIEERSVIKGITAIEDLAMITVAGESMVSLPGSAAKIFSAMAEHNINIIFISQSSSENNITFGVSGKDGFAAGNILADSKYFGKRWVKVRVEHDVSLIAVIGAGMAHTPGVAGRVFTALGNAGINIRAIAQGSSELNITFVVSRKQLGRAVRLLYHTFIESGEETVSFW